MKMELKAAFDGLKRNTQTPLFQVAALCLRSTEHGQEVLLITSSENRWILPKGWPMEGKSNAEAAAIEAWEEAGVVPFHVSDAPLTQLITCKEQADGKIVPCHLDIFRIDVITLSKDYPEAHKRERKWVSLTQAANDVSDPALSQFLANF